MGSGAAGVTARPIPAPARGRRSRACRECGVEAVALQAARGVRRGQMLTTEAARFPPLCVHNREVDDHGCIGRQERRSEAPHRLDLAVDLDRAVGVGSARTHDRRRNPLGRVAAVRASREHAREVGPEVEMAPFAVDPDVDQPETTPSV